MSRACTLLLLLLGLPSLGWGDELSDLFSRMEKAREGLKTLRAQVTLWQKEGSLAKEETPYSRGELTFRAPGDFAWSLHDARRGGGPDGKRATLTPTEFLFHVPWGSKEHGPLTSVVGRDRHGAEWFRAAPAGETPPLLPLLADYPWQFPVVLILDLAPGRFLATLPRLKLGPTKTEGGRTFHVLEFRPEGGDKERAAEVDRFWNRETFYHGEAWVDAADLRLARLRLRFTGHDRRYSVLARADGVAKTILTEIERDQDGRTYAQRLELTPLESNPGLEGLRQEIPAGRLVRDWTTRPEEHYEARLKKDPTDAAAWLEIGALRMERGDWEPAEAAFRKVAELRPDAPEGYLGLLRALELNRDKGAGVEVLEKAAPLGWPLFHREAAQRYLVKGDRDSARRHYESILALLGEDLETLREMARTVARDEAERKGFAYRAIRQDLDHGEGAGAHSVRRQDLHPSNEEREELLALHRAALTKNAARPWIHLSLMELEEQLGHKDGSRRCAEDLLRLLEAGKPGLGRYDTLALLKVFLADKDLDRAQRLQKATASVEIQGEIVAVFKDLDAIVRHLDGPLPPEMRKIFLEAVKREQKLEALAARLLETPGDAATGVLDTISGLMAGSDRQKLLLRVAERRGRKSPDPLVQLPLVQSLVREKKWAEARTQAEALLAWKDLSRDGRGVAETAMAECHDAAGEYDLAVAAGERALAASPARAPWIRLIQVRALLSAKKVEKAVEVCATAFEEGLPAPDDAETRSPEGFLLQSLRGTLIAREDLQGEVETAAAANPKRFGVQVLMALVEERRGHPEGARRSFERACAIRPTATLLREVLLAQLAAGLIDEAIAVRGRIAAVCHRRPVKAGSDAPYDLEALDEKVLKACRETADVASTKRFARALAAEPLGRFGLERTLRDLLLEVLEEDFFAEIEAALVRNAKDEWQRFHAYFPTAWAYADLGLGARGAAIYERALREQAWSEHYRSFGASWIEELRGRTEGTAVRAPNLFGAHDECEAVADAASVTPDRAWRFRVRQGNAAPIWLKLGAVRGRTVEERLDCLVELLRRGEPRPEWTLMLGVALVERGEEDRAAAVFGRLLAATPEAERAELWSFLVDEQLDKRRGRPASTRAWSMHWVAEARLEQAEGAEERLGASMEFAQILEDEGSPLLALIALSSAGEGQTSDRYLKQWKTLRARLPSDPVRAIREAKLRPPGEREAARAAELVGELGSDDFEVRSAACRGLTRMGAAALPSVLTLLDSSDADLQSHARDILRAHFGETASKP